MTNEELDRWIAERVMGWRDRDGDWRSECQLPHYSTGRVGAFGCEECEVWHPTTNITQAIEAGEKAREQGRIHLWGVCSEAASVSTNRKDLDALRVVRHVEGEHWATALCRALYEALREDS